MRTPVTPELASGDARVAPSKQFADSQLLYVCEQTRRVHVWQIREPGIIDFITQGLQGAGESAQESAGELQSELAFPLGDIARPDVPVANARETAKKAVPPKTTAGNRPLLLVETQEGGDPAPILQLRILSQLLVARLEAIRPAISPVGQIAQRAGRGMIHLEEVSVELSRLGPLADALVCGVVVARNRFVQPVLGRLAVIVHGRDQHIARIADDVKDTDVVPLEKLRALAEIRIDVEKDERLSRRAGLSRHPPADLKSMHRTPNSHAIALNTPSIQTVPVL